MHWRFDEESGALALDATGQGNTGAYVGEPTLPGASTAVPSTMFPNPRSREFAATGRPGVLLANVGVALRPANDLSVSLWFRTSVATTTGADVFNLGSDVLLRIKPTDIEFAKRVSNVTGMIYAVVKTPALTTHLNNAWHHLGAVTTATGMKIYFDGALVGSNARGEPVVYEGTTHDLWCGRDGQAVAGRDFSGGIDDVRIYTRALTAEEIAALAAGGN